ncbi:bifunctional metallophosphatase/5'-nucleotidase [Bacillus massiliigorillae]|uniref:bifunctional metallophosphatase/5'-nucleotidase n=1 Tax=Bacillus massiliigorillae TaxID=1243664 RepID=UPI0003A921B7|nr:5'-nucleotidase C-terminal domain-containing protein [Bacillus massiliigorillae]
MHTNDTHANLDSVPRKITAIEQVRAEKPYNVLLSAGDVFSGTLYFNKFLGQADLEFMNMAKYDAMTFGNHEFDKDSETLGNFIKNAQFPFVSANIDFSKDDLLKQYFNQKYSSKPNNAEIYNGIVKTINGEKVGIFGLTTEETPSIASPGSVTFSNYIESAKSAVAEFEKQGVNKIVALTHIGYKDGGIDDDTQLANHVEGIDVIVGGHDHRGLTEPVLVEKFDEPTIIVQANEYNKYLGTLDVTFDADGKIIGHAGQLIDLNAKTEAGEYVIPANKEASEILNTKYKPAVDEMEQEVVGKSEVELLGGNPPSRIGETNLGNFIADGMLAKAKSLNPKTVMAVQNGGGVRTTLPAGDITTGSILKVLPFSNTLGIMELKGSEIAEAIEYSVEMAPTPNGRFLQVAGMKFKYDSSKPAGEKVLSIEVQNGDKYEPLNNEETYFVATNVFTAKGGDGYTMFEKAFNEGRVSQPGYVDWEVFKEHLEAQPNKTIAPQVEGRIIDVATQK